MPMVVLPADSPTPPQPHEIEVAWILARHFGVMVEFLRPSDGYRMKTADMVMNGLIWEIKSPIGSGRSTVPNQFRRASKQSRYVVFDARRIHLDESRVLAEVLREAETHRHIKAILFITKAGVVLSIWPA